MSADERQLERIALELARRRLYERIRYFQPHGGQAEFIRLIEQEGAFIVVSGAGNGWGGSEMIVAIFAAIMWPQLAPASLRAPIFSEWQYPKRARIYSTPAELEEIGAIQTAAARLFPRGRYTFSKGRYSYPSIFKTDTGWVLDMFSYDRHEREAAGPNIGLQAFNEPPPEALWKEAIARSRAGGMILGKMTSLQENAWVVDGIFNKADGKAVRIRYGSSCENCKQHGTNGTLEHARIEQILAQYDPDEREARFTGRPLSMSGRIFKSFDAAVHVAAEDFEPPKDEPISIGHIVDPAVGKPLAMVWRYVDLDGVVNYFDEYPDFEFHGAKDQNLGVPQYVDIIKAKEKGCHVETRILDRHYSNRRQTMGGKTLKQEFAEADLHFQDSYEMQEEVETGILKVKDYLRYDASKPIDSINRPRIRISPRCKNLIAAFKLWARDPKNGKPKEAYKDFMDLVRYDLMSEPEVRRDSPLWTGQRPQWGVGNA